MSNRYKILVIESDTIELMLVENFLQEFFTEKNLKKSIFNKVYLCISEAVVNAIEHGNKNKREKNVCIGIKYEDDRLDVFIKDEGDGFDMNSVVDPTVLQNIKKESGRGIFIIKTLSDSIAYNEVGNFIQFKIECGE